MPDCSTFPTLCSALEGFDGIMATVDRRGLHVAFVQGGFAAAVVIECTVHSAYIRLTPHRFHSRPAPSAGDADSRKLVRIAHFDIFTPGCVALKSKGLRFLILLPHIPVECASSSRHSPARSYLQPRSCSRHRGAWLGGTRASAIKSRVPATLLRMFFGCDSCFRHSELRILAQFFAFWALTVVLECPWSLCGAARMALAGS